MLLEEVYNTLLPSIDEPVDTTNQSIVQQIEAAMSIYQLKKIFSQLDLQTEVTIESILPLKDFLAKRWELIRETDATYNFNEPSTNIAKLCRQLAMLLASYSGVTPYDLLMPMGLNNGCDEDDIDLNYVSRIEEEPNAIAPFSDIFEQLQGDIGNSRKSYSKEGELLLLKRLIEPEHYTEIVAMLNECENREHALTSEWLCYLLNNLPESERLSYLPLYKALESHIKNVDGLVKLLLSHYTQEADRMHFLRALGKISMQALINNYMELCSILSTLSRQGQMEFLRWQDKVNLLAIIKDELGLAKLLAHLQPEDWKILLDCLGKDSLLQIIIKDELGLAKLLTQLQPEDWKILLDCLGKDSLLQIIIKDELGLAKLLSYLQPEDWKILLDCLGKDSLLQIIIKDELGLAKLLTQLRLEDSPTFQNYSVYWNRFLDWLSKNRFRVLIKDEVALANLLANLQSNSWNIFLNWLGKSYLQRVYIKNRGDLTTLLAYQPKQVRPAYLSYLGNDILSAVIVDEGELAKLLTYLSPNDWNNILNLLGKSWLQQTIIKDELGLAKLLTKLPPEDWKIVLDYLGKDNLLDIFNNSSRFSNLLARLPINDWNDFLSCLDKDWLQKIIIKNAMGLAKLLTNLPNKGWKTFLDWLSKDTTLAIVKNGAGLGQVLVKLPPEDWRIFLDWPDKSSLLTIINNGEEFGILLAQLPPEDWNDFLKYLGNDWLQQIIIKDSAELGKVLAKASLKDKDGSTFLLKLLNFNQKFNAQVLTWIKKESNLKLRDELCLAMLGVYIKKRATNKNQYKKKVFGWLFGCSRQRKLDAAQKFQRTIEENVPEMLNNLFRDYQRELNSGELGTIAYCYMKNKPVNRISEQLHQDKGLQMKVLNL